MLISSIQFHNFRQFKDSDKIVFSQEKDKNISVFLGKNTTGKTTILQAFLWCFYDKTSFSREDDELYNFEVARDAKIGDTIPVSVTIELLHKSSKFTLLKSIEYEKYEKSIQKKNVSPKLSVTETNEKGVSRKLQDKDADALMEQILPESLSQFFFIENEKLTNIRQRSDIKQSLETILGLDGIKQAIKDYGQEGISKGYSVLAMLNRDMRKNAPTAAEDIKNELDRTEIDLETVNKDIEEKEQEKALYEKSLQNMKAKIDSLTEQQKEKDRKNDLKNKITRYECNLIQQKKDLEFLLRSVFSMVCLDPLNKSCKKLGAHCKESSNNPSLELTSAGLEKILSTQRCICGRELCDNDRILLEARKLINNIKERERSNKLEELLKSLQSSVPDNQNIAIDIYEATKNYFTIQNDIRRQHEFLASIALNEDDENNLRYYTDEITKLSNEIANYNIDLNLLHSKKQKLEKSLKELSDKIIDINRQLDRTRELSRQLDYAKAVLKNLESHYKKRTTKLVNELENEVNSIFTKIYTGDRLIKIDDKYNISSYSESLGESKPIDESGGLTTIVCLSFIGGLLSLAKKKIMDSSYSKYLSDEETPESRYPLILDAPFSKTDETHIENIVSTLPDIAEQLIIFVMDKDFKISLANCKDKIGKIYRLNKHTETYTTIEPEKENY